MSGTWDNLWRQQDVNSTGLRWPLAYDTDTAMSCNFNLFAIGLAPPTACSLSQAMIHAPGSFKFGAKERHGVKRYSGRKRGHRKNGTSGGDPGDADHVGELLIAGTGHGAAAASGSQLGGCSPRQRPQLCEQKETEGYPPLPGMHPAMLQLDTVLALFVLVSWCHGGITNINCSGNMWVEPATVFQMGTNISVYCQAAMRSCQPRKFYFYKNGFRENSPMTRINRTTARLWYKSFMDPHAAMYCTAECPGRLRETLICGKDISSGYPPDAPKEVTCVIYEHSGHMTCTWNPGKATHIHTEYVVHVKSLETEEEQQYVTSRYINISTDLLRGGKKYLVWVRAANALGMEDSRPLQIWLDDIVIPSATLISRAETVNATAGRTVIHWKSETALQQLSCELRYRASTQQTWTVKELNNTFPSAQQLEFDLEPGTLYVFQVRCRQASARYWQPWSAPFTHTVPEADRQGAKLLSGMVSLAVFLSLLSLVVIFSRSLRTRIKRKILLLMPRWLQEDIPNMEKSNIAKMLQEKSEFVNSTLSEPVLYVDPVITEIEVIHPKEHIPTTNRKEGNLGPMETGNSPQLPEFPRGTVVYIPDPSTSYKPQISDILPGRDHISDSEETASPAPHPAADPLDPRNSVWFKKSPRFTSSMNSLSNTLILEELSLLLNPGEVSFSDLQHSEEGGKHSPSEPFPEQTLLPDELVSCLGITGEDLPSPSPYFPQNILKSHFNGISLLEK
ncbi:interleukin-23 receptor [Ctenodactylus gundi]